MIKYIATATIKTKLVATPVIKDKIVADISYPTLTASCPQYNLIDGGTPSWNYQPIGSFDLISGGNP